MDSSNYPEIKCPRCGSPLPVDSVREHSNGKKRVYWECDACKLSIMDRDYQETV